MIDANSFSKKWNIDWTKPGLGLGLGTVKWLRFHTLPNSKRYPDNDQELATILTRHHTLLNELGAGKQPLLVVVSAWTNVPEPSPEPWDKYGRLDIDVSYWQSVLENPDETDPDFKSYRQLYVGSFPSQDEKLDALLRQVANDKMSGAILTPEDFSWIYHPYDGGVDILLSSVEEREKLMGSHEDWLPVPPTP